MQMVIYIDLSWNLKQKRQVGSNGIPNWPKHNLRKALNTCTYVSAPRLRCLDAFAHCTVYVSVENIPEERQEFIYHLLSICGQPLMLLLMSLLSGSDIADQILTVLCSTNMFVGGFCGFVLDNTVPGQSYRFNSLGVILYWPGISITGNYSHRELLKKLYFFLSLKTQW